MARLLVTCFNGGGHIFNRLKPEVERLGDWQVNSRLKRRLVVVTGVIVVVVLVVLAVVNGATSAKDITVAQAVSGDFNGIKVLVEGKVVDNSYSLDGNVLSFSIYEDADGEDGTSASGTGATRPQLKVTYDQGVSATFGNQIEAICTGTINESGVLVCTTLVTKCPSKYESSTDALSVSQLLSYGERMVGTVVKVTGTIQAGTLRSAAEQQERFVLIGADNNVGAGGAGASIELPVVYGGALSDEVRDSSEVVLTGKLNDKGQFEASDVALRG
jgi:cytochrome c-type biogenesis protein CcmE